MNSIESRIIKTELIKWTNLKFIQQDNFKEWNYKGQEKLFESMLKYQFIDPFKVWEYEGDIYCMDGRHRYLDLMHLKKQGHVIPDLLPATFIRCKDKKEAAELVLIYSSHYATITKEGLIDFTENYEIDFLDLPVFSLPTFDEIELHELFNPEEKDEIPGTSLKEDFGIVPFSILDTRTAEWLQRRKQWNELGFDSQETREDVELIAQSGQSTQIYNLRNKMRKALGRDPEWNEIIAYAEKKNMHLFKGASIFDPVLCECLYNWFTVKDHKILDPFSGGSVRGIVAGKLERKYFGIDLRLEQVEANVSQVEKLKLENINYCAGDSNKVLDKVEDKYQFVFSCPPYHDLEHYSDDPDDLSNMEYDEFMDVYRSIIKKSVQKLEDNSFACFVVGDIRDKQGYYRNFVSETIQAFKDAGMELYNEMILINSIGSMAIRLRKQFNTGRKCGKIHQNVLVFYKGDPKTIRDNYPELKFDDILEESIIE